MHDGELSQKQLELCAAISRELSNLFAQVEIVQPALEDTQVDAWHPLHAFASPKEFWCELRAQTVRVAK